MRARNLGEAALRYAHCRRTVPNRKVLEGLLVPSLAQHIWFGRTCRSAGPGAGRRACVRRLRGQRKGRQAPILPLLSQAAELRQGRNSAELINVFVRTVHSVECEAMGIFQAEGWPGAEHI